MFVYQIVNKINKKKYVGITTKSIEHRFKQHVKQLDCGIANAIKKYGEKNFYIEQIDECDTWENLLIKEKFWIQKLNPEYNRTKGGEGLFGYNHTEQAKEEISRKNKGRIFTKEHREKLSKSNKGKSPWNKGKKCSEEYKKLKSTNKINYYNTEEGTETKEKISKTLKEKGISPPKELRGETKGTKWWNNGKINKRTIECPGEDFILGRIKGEWKWSKNI